MRSQRSLPALVQELACHPSVLQQCPSHALPLPQHLSCRLHQGKGKLRQAGKEGAGEGRRSALLQAGSKVQVARIDPAIPKAIREQLTASIRLLCAGWDLLCWDPRAKAVLFICKATGEELAGEHGPGFRAMCQPGRGGGGQARCRTGALCVAEQLQQETRLALGCPGS